jgi:hypothetical protein
MANPRVNNDDPARVKAAVVPPDTKGQNNRAYPMKDATSQPASCAMSVDAASPARTRSRRRYSAMPEVTSRNVLATTASTQLVSQPPTGRGTIRVATTLTPTASTSTAPTAAATERATSGTSMGSPPF